MLYYEYAIPFWLCYLKLRFRLFLSGKMQPLLAGEEQSADLGTIHHGEYQRRKSRRLRG